MRFPTIPLWIRQALPMAIVATLWNAQAASARPQYAAELTRLLANQPDEEVAKTAARLQCRLCHTTNPPERKHNVFGREVARALMDERDVSDRREIQMALHRAVFLLRNRKPSPAEPPKTVRKRYVGSVLKEDSELAAYEMPLSDVLAVLAENHEIAMEQDVEAFKRAGISRDVPVSLVLSEVPLESLLKFLLAEHHLTYEIKGNGLIVRPEMPQEIPKPSRNPMAKSENEIASELAKTLKKYRGARVQVTEKGGMRLSEILLDLHVTQDGRLDAISLFFAKSSSRKRHIQLANIKEIRSLNQLLYSVPEESDPVVIQSRLLEQDVLKRERARRAARQQAAFRRRAGLGKPAESLQDENRRFPLDRRYEEELGEAAQVVGAIGGLAANQAAETPPGENPAEKEQPAESRSEAVHSSGPQPPAGSPRTEMARKTVILKYRSATGNPPRIRYGARIRYETEDSDDPQVQQGTLNDEGQCELAVPADVQTLRLYTTPFGGFEGTYPLQASGSTTITISIQGE